MSAWSSAELDRIAAAEELELASARRDGTLRNPVTMWVVRHEHWPTRSASLASAAVRGVGVAVWAVRDGVIRRFDVIGNR